MWYSRLKEIKKMNYTQNIMWILKQTQVSRCKIFLKFYVCKKSTEKVQNIQCEIRKKKVLLLWDDKWQKIKHMWEENSCWNQLALNFSRLKESPSRKKIPSLNSPTKNSPQTENIFDKFTPLFVFLARYATYHSLHMVTHSPTQGRLSWYFLNNWLPPWLQ